MESARKMPEFREQEFIPHVLVGDAPGIPYAVNLPTTDEQSWPMHDATPYYPETTPPVGFISPAGGLQDPTGYMYAPSQPQQPWHGYCDTENANDFARQLAHRARRGPAVRSHHQHHHHHHQQQQQQQQQQQPRGRREGAPRHRSTPIRKPSSRSSLRDRTDTKPRDSLRMSSGTTTTGHQSTPSSAYAEHQTTLPDCAAVGFHQLNNTFHEPPFEHQSIHNNTPAGHQGTAIPESEEAAQEDSETTPGQEPLPGLLNWRADKPLEGNRRNGGVGHFGLEHGFQVLWRRPR